MVNPRAVTEESLEAMQTLLAGAGVELGGEDWAFFERLRLHILARNALMNLTRLTARPDFFRKQVLDSLLPFEVVPDLKRLGTGCLVADLGSGAGFPGFVLARMHPSWDIGLIERTQKKAAFLEETAAAFDLQNVFVVPMDALEAGRTVPLLAARCEGVCARAVGRMAPVTRAAAPLLRRDGLIVHYKGGDPDTRELADARRTAAGLGLKMQEPFRYDLPPDAKRSVVLMRRA